MDREGTAWAVNVPLTPDWNEVVIPLASLRPRSVGRVPVAYPTRAIERLLVRADRTPVFHIENWEAIQFSLPAALYEGATEGPHGVEIESVSLAK
jgi:hypothetical protein